MADDQLPPLDKFRPNNKSVRKISLPTWLRSSPNRSSQSLPRQHTIDTPESFLISKKTSSGAKTPISPLAILDFDESKSDSNNFSKVEIINDSEGNGEDTPKTPTSPITKRKGGFSGKKWLPEPLRKLSRHKGKKSRNKEGLAAATLTKGSQDNISAATQPEDAAKLESEQDIKIESTALDEPDNSNSTQTPNLENLYLANFYALSDIVTESETDADSAADMSSSNVDTEKEKMDIINLEAEAAQPEKTMKEQALKNRDFALKELISTEESYIKDLALIVEGYIPEIRDPNSSITMPEDLGGGKERMVFGNIEAIYEWHRDYFLKSLRQCEHKLTELGPLITKCERKLRMYVVYCQNKPISEYIVAEHIGYFEEIGRKLKHKLLLSDLLIKPVQRITKYELLLKDILKQCERLGIQEEIDSLKKALRIMNVVPKDANDMMDVGRLQNFDGNITSQGKLLLHDKFLCIEGNTNDKNNTGGTKKAKDCQVFLFDQSIIFSDISGKKTRFVNPSYLYKTHLQLNKLTVKDISDANTPKLFINSTDPRRCNVSFICIAPSIETHQEWLNKIEQILEAQRNFLKKIVNPQK